MNSPNHTFDVAVVGTGPVGLTAALALSAADVHVALLGPGEQPGGRHEDRRTAALFAGSIELLRNLDVWESCAPDCAPLVGIRMIDSRDALLRAPEVLFHARDVGRDSFGFNVPNRALSTALWQQVRAMSDTITTVTTDAVRRVMPADPVSTLELDGGLHIAARLVVGADGRNSICRSSAQIKTQTWTYPQAAIACVFQHHRPHNDISSEFHDYPGPLTVVPMPGHVSSLVWVVTPSEAERLQALDDDSFAATLEDKLNGLLGEISSVSHRAVFPLSGLTAEQVGANGVALVGEAAHVIPPIGAQGLNLGLRDCAELADCVAVGRDVSGAWNTVEVLARYNNKRHFDIHSRTNAVDLFNRSLLSAFLPAHLARGVGLHLMKSFAPLRRWAVQEGLTPTGTKPALMQVGGQLTNQESDIR